MTYICCEILFVNLASCQIEDRGQPKQKHTGSVQYLWSSTETPLQNIYNKQNL